MFFFLFVISLARLIAFCYLAFFAYFRKYYYLTIAVAVYTHKTLNELAKYYPDCSGIFVIIDKHLSKYFHYFNGMPLIKITANEESKTIETVEAVIHRLLQLDADRDCFIVGVGGGITTDIAGFVASIYKRGVRFGFVPTTLLAQADAAIGGKNGVNEHNVKNTIGTINQPLWVYQSPEFFKTLPPRVFREGVAEILKTFLIFDPSYYRLSVDFFSSYIPDKSTAKEEKVLDDIISKCSFYKNVVVNKDEKERGERRVLNLGHTLGHTIEKFSNDEMEREIKRSSKKDITPEYMHGEAVGIGIIMAAMISHSAGNCSQKFVDMLRHDFSKVGLPVECSYKLNKLLKYIKTDKKVSGHKIHFIMPYCPGDIKDELISLSELYKLAKESEGLE